MTRLIPAAAPTHPRPDRPSTPPSAPGLVHVWSTCHRSRAVRNGLQRSPAVGRSRRSPVRSCGNRSRGRTLIRMRSQVQVLAGPPPSSQVRALPAASRARSLLAWAALGPHADPRRHVQWPLRGRPPGRQARRRPPTVVAYPARGRQPRGGVATARCSLHPCPPRRRRDGLCTPAWPAWSLSGKRGRRGPHPPRRPGPPATSH
jgi:hypothetical protein